MSDARSEVAAVEGWFEHDGEQAWLLGNRCTSCRTVFFPRADILCRNPHCAGDRFDEVRLSRTGRLWSWTDNRYQPPPPYVSPEPFRPYGVAAVELADEKMVVLGQLADDVNRTALTVGQPMELTVGTLYEDAGHRYLVWKWRPAGEPA